MQHPSIPVPVGSGTGDGGSHDILGTGLVFPLDGKNGHNDGESINYFMMSLCINVQRDIYHCKGNQCFRKNTIFANETKLH